MPTDKQHNESEFWYGRNLLCGDKPIYVYDWRHIDPNWKGAITVRNNTVTRANVADFEHFGPLTIESDVIAKHAVIHHDNPASLYDLTRESEIVVLWASSRPTRPGGVQIIPSSPAEVKVVQFAMVDGAAYRSGDGIWLSEFLNLTFAQAKTLAGCRSRADAAAFELANPGFSHFLNIILPGRLENVLAFRLLCEAAKAVAEENEQRTVRGEQVLNTAQVNRITIHAPANPGEWLAPFGESTATDIPYVAAMMGSDLKDKAQAVLEAVNKGQLKSTELNDYITASQSAPANT